ncbi:MAG TPA: hypothetical protein VGH76_01820 [Actinomycetospora sp.]|jgi:beta-phosphoglucomutase-like phosphatase (HAD superfamily)|uniref:hypothetical protein n=1 Tax=Actinomycetospora sp. TaxID=1872135 RepID=UPI002F3E888D
MITGEAFAAVLFDMKGTLVDPDAAVERSWRIWAEPDPESTSSDLTDLVPRTPARRTTA